MASIWDIMAQQQQANSGMDKQNQAGSQLAQMAGVDPGLIALHKGAVSKPVPQGPKIDPVQAALFAKALQGGAA